MSFSLTPIERAGMALILLTSLLLLSYGDVNAQEKTDPVNEDGGTKHAMALGALIPVSSFAQSHVAGAEVGYLRFLRLGKKNNLQSSWVIVLSGAIEYYIGKKVNTAGYPFRFGNNTNVLLMGGLRFTPSPPFYFSLAAGPVLGIYKSGTYGAIGVNFNSGYKFSDRLSIGPGVYYRKQHKADALWSLTIRASYDF